LCNDHEQRLHIPVQLGQLDRIRSQYVRERIRPCWYYASQALTAVAMFVDRGGVKVADIPFPGLGASLNLYAEFALSGQRLHSRARGLNGFSNYFIRMRETQESALKLRRRQVDSFFKHRPKETSVALSVRFFCRPPISYRTFGEERCHH